MQISHETKSPFRTANPPPLLAVVRGVPTFQVLVEGSYTSTEFSGFQPSQPPTAQILPWKLVTAAWKRPG